MSDIKIDSFQDRSIQEPISKRYRLPSLSHRTIAAVAMTIALIAAAIFVVADLCFTGGVVSAIAFSGLSNCVGFSLLGLYHYILMCKETSVIQAPAMPLTRTLSRSSI